MQNVQNAIINAFTAANKGYIARNGAKAKLAANGFQDDVSAGLKTFNEMTIPQMQKLASYGIDWARVGDYIANCSNVKIARRSAQLPLFVMTGDPKYCTGSTKTAFLIYCALHANAKTKDALRFAATGKGNESTSDEISVQRARAVLRAFGAVNGSSYDTQASVSAKDGGLLDMFGLITPWAKGDRMPEIIDCTFGRAIGAFLEGLTDGQIELFAAPRK